MVPSEAANILVEYPPRFDASTVKKFRTGRDGAKSCLIFTFPLQSCWGTSRSWMTGSILSLFRVHACGQFGSTTLSLTYLWLSRVWAFFQTDRIQIIRVRGLKSRPHTVKRSLLWWMASNMVWKLRFLNYPSTSTPFLRQQDSLLYVRANPSDAPAKNKVHPHTVVIFISQVVPGCSIAMWLGMELLSSSASSMRHLLTILPNSWGHTITHRLPWFLKRTTTTTNIRSVVVVFSILFVSPLSPFIHGKDVLFNSYFRAFLACWTCIRRTMLPRIFVTWSVQGPCSVGSAELGMNDFFIL